MTDIEFNHDGWPLNPTSGKPYRPAEIIHDLSGAIPYPTFVDPANPGRYWQRREPARRRPRRSRPSTRRVSASSILGRMSVRSGAEVQAEVRAEATAEMVGRVNDKKEGSEC